MLQRCEGIADNVWLRKQHFLSAALAAAVPASIRRVQPRIREHRDVIGVAVLVLLLLLLLLLLILLLRIILFLLAFPPPSSPAEDPSPAPPSAPRCRPTLNST